MGGGCDFRIITNTRIISKHILVAVIMIIVVFRWKPFGNKIKKNTFIISIVELILKTFWVYWYLFIPNKKKHIDSIFERFWLKKFLTNIKISTYSFLTKTCLSSSSLFSFSSFVFLPSYFVVFYNLNGSSDSTRFKPHQWYLVASFINNLVAYIVNHSFPP